MSELQCKYSSYGYDYKPVGMVQAFHSIPHSDNLNFTTMGVTTETNGDFVMADYVVDVSGLPYLIFILGCCSVVLFQVLLIVRGDWLKGGPAGFALNKYEGWQLNAVRKKNFLYVLYHLILLLLLAFNNFTFIEYSNLFNGSAHIRSRMDTFHTLDSDMLSISGLVSSQMTQVGVHINSTSCGTTFTKDHIYNIEQLMLTFDHTMDTLTTGLDDLRSVLDPASVYDSSSPTKYWIGGSTLETNTYVMLFGTYVVVLIVGLLFVLFPCCQQAQAMKVASFLVQFLILVLAAVCCLEMMSITLMSDFCMDPDQNLLDFTAAGGNSSGITGNGNKLNILNQLLSYYTDCSGPSIVHTELQTALTEVVTLRTYLSNRFADSTDACYNDPHFSFSVILLAEVHDNLDYLSCSLVCDAVATSWYELVHVGFCTEFLSGFGAFWLQKFVSSGLLFALICTASVLYQFFGRWWELKTYSIFPHTGDPDEVYVLERPPPLGGGAYDSDNDNHEESSSKKSNSKNSVRNHQSRKSRDGIDDNNISNDHGHGHGDEHNNNSSSRKGRRRSFSGDDPDPENPDIVSPFKPEPHDSDSDSYRERSRSRSKSHSHTAGGGRKYRGPDMIDYTNHHDRDNREHKDQHDGGHDHEQHKPHNPARRGSRTSSRDGSRANSRRSSFDVGQRGHDHDHEHEHHHMHGGQSSRKSASNVSDKHEHILYVNPTPPPGPLHGHLPHPFMAGTQVKRKEEIPRHLSHPGGTAKNTSLEEL